MKNIIFNILISSFIFIFVYSSYGQYEAVEHHNPNKTVDEINNLFDSLQLTSGIASQDDYIKMYLGYKQNESLFMEKGLKNYFYDMFAPYSSFIGEYEETLESIDKKGISSEKYTAEDSLEISLYQTVKAKELLLKIADTSRIIIINEAHHIPNHRIFTTEILKDLYDKGFRYFAAETICNESGIKDSLLKNGNYPELWTGYYTLEPLYGDLIRQALNTGYKIIPYEKPADSNSEREYTMANNLSKVFANDKNAKILIHCGYAHIKKTWMTGFLEKLTGLNSFRIDQTLMMERSKEEYINKYYQLADKKFNLTEPVFLTKGDGDYSFKSDGFADAVMFLPKTKYVNGRPDWMSMSGYRKPFEINISSQLPEDNLLIQAFNQNENSETAVPVDMVLTKKGIKEYTLMLPSGKYNIVFRKTGDIILEKKSIEVK